MSARLKAEATLVAGLGASLLYASHWRSRAHAASDVEIEQATAEQLTTLSTADAEDVGTMLAIYSVEGETPPMPDRRFFWWVAARCADCGWLVGPRLGWEPTRRAARAELAEAIEDLSDPDTCESPDHPHDEDDDEHDA